MNIKESIQQIETLIEAWQLDEADLNQTDINAMQSLLKENQMLKEKLDKYENPEDMTLMMMWCTENVKEENERLKKKYENAVTDYETTMFEKEQLNSLVNSCQEEIRQLKKQVEEKENIACNWKDSCLENAGKIEILETQQKEFIKYLETWKENEEYCYLASSPIDRCRKDIYEEILQKYKSIIGVSDENKRN